MDAEREALLIEQFGYAPHYECVQRKGWLLNYKAVSDPLSALSTRLYFVDGQGGFTCTLPYFPSFLVETDSLDVVDEYLKKRFESVHSIEIVDRVDTSAFNHLNLPRASLLKVRFLTENAFVRARAEIRRVLQARRNAQVDDEMFKSFVVDTIDQRIGAESAIAGIHEHDIPTEIAMLIDLDLQCGSWYLVSRHDEAYVFVRHDDISHPELRILAFDIETTKQPLKFPNADYDEVMMISMMCNEGYLIVNRAIVSEDIVDFEYSPKDDMQGCFRAYNETSEETLLLRFYEIIQKYRPHVVTTYNGSAFDFPFMEKRTQRYGLSLAGLTGFLLVEDTYVSPFMVHLDCYKWVRRDSYLPMGSQGLKAVTRIKLGYFPDDLNPEIMVECAQKDPHRLASYSVSDVVATYYLFMRYVQPFIFSLSTLIPMPPVSVLVKGSGALCEALLLVEAYKGGILIPNKKREAKLADHNGHVVENYNYVGGHVECLRAGVFRADIEYKFTIDAQTLRDLETEGVLHNANIEAIKSKQASYFASSSQDGAAQIVLRDKPLIYHLDVGAMYPNIILTNKLQPIAMKTADDCMRCDYFTSKVCQKNMNWELRAEYYPPTREEVSMIRSQLEKEYFARTAPSKSQGTAAKSVDGAEKVIFAKLSDAEQDTIFKKRLAKYSQKIYRRVSAVETSTQTSTVCQRELPFYLDTVKKFRDQRYHYKKLSKANSPFKHIYESLQVAHKVVLNSFYGYTMRRGSRWYSMEMAAVVCNRGKEIIMEAKDLIEKVGVVLEVDTDGIWCMVPACFPVEINGVNTLVTMLNKMVEAKFTNHQYQVEYRNEGANIGATQTNTLVHEGKVGRIAPRFETISYNSTFFEVDGPYKAMVLPSSVEENKLTKKKYVVFDFRDKISELKGFETKRRGELNLIKKFQEDLFDKFVLGHDLESCYKILGGVADYWLDIVQHKAQGLSDDEIFYLFSESKNMAKRFDEYEGRKALNTCTAEKISEFGVVLEAGLKCEFVIAAYPENEPIASRAIPVNVFLLEKTKKAQHLRKWLRRDVSDIRQILDWGYYEDRLKTIIQKLVCMPAKAQGVDNPVRRVDLPKWATKVKSGSMKDWVRVADPIERRIRDIEDLHFSPTQVDVRGHSYSDYVKQKSTEWVSQFKERARWWKEEVLEVDAVAQTVRFRQGGQIRSRPLIHVREHFVIPVHAGIDQAAWMRTVTGDENLRDVSVYLANTPFPVNVYVSSTCRDSLAYFLYEENEYSIVHDHPRNSSAPLSCVFVTVFAFGKKTFYALTIDAQTEFYSESKDLDVRSGMASVTAVSDMAKVLEAYASTHILVHNDSFRLRYAGPACNVKVSHPRSLEAFEQLLASQVKLHAEMRSVFATLDALSAYANVPLLNTNDCVLDHMYFAILKRASVLCVEGSQRVGNGTLELPLHLQVLKDTFCVPGYYEKVCVEIRCANSLVVGVLEHATTLGRDTMYDGVQRNDFKALFALFRTLYMDSADNSSVVYLLRLVENWVRTSRLTRSLWPVLSLLKTRYVIGLVHILKELKVEVVAVNKEIICIEIGKVGMLRYVEEKIRGTQGYEMVSMEVVRAYSKLIYVSPIEYFFVEHKAMCVCADGCACATDAECPECGTEPCSKHNGSESAIMSFSQARVPLEFLKKYFGNQAVPNDYFYALVVKELVSAESVKLMLKMMAFRGDYSVLRANCFKLMKISEFSRDAREVTGDIVCRWCGCDNVFRAGKLNKCYACFRKFSVEEVEETLMGLVRMLFVACSGHSFFSLCDCFEKRRDEWVVLQSACTTERYGRFVREYAAFFGTE